MPARFEGGVALITGAAVGIGAATAERLAAEGAKVLLVDVDKAAADATAERIRGSGGTAEAFAADVSNEPEIEGAIQQAVRLWGRLDLLVNNAANFDSAGIFNITPELWDTAFAVNVKGYALCMKHALAAMQACGAKGSIVNLGSVASFRGLPDLIPYAPTKGAVVQLTRCAAIDVRDRGVRINAVCPGPILTGATERVAAARGTTIDETFAPMAQRMATPRMGRPDEVAAAIAFLASDDASFINGECLMVDGGFSIF